MLYSGAYASEVKKSDDTQKVSDIYVGYNFYSEEVSLALPKVASGKKTQKNWYLKMDSASDKVIYDSDGELAANKEKIELNYPPYSLISVVAPSETAINELTEIVIKTTSDVTKLRITNQKGDTATFIRSSVNTSWVDNGDGTATWTLKYSFTSEGTQEWAVQIRNNAWSAIDEKSTFEITAE
jgi:hypothetical protein